MPAHDPDERVLIIAPMGQDAVAIETLLREHGVGAEICDGTCEQLVEHAGALLLTEEALELPTVQQLLESLHQQPAWSELPILILTSGGEDRLRKLLETATTSAGSVTLLERPLGAATLLRSVQVALSSRRRQYQVRDLLKEQRVLFKLTDRLHRANSFQEVYEATLDAIFDTLNCNRASILLFDEHEVVRFVAWRGLSERYRRAVDRHSPWKPHSPDPKPITFEDIETADLEPALKSAVKEEGIQALAFVPLMAGGKVLGKFMTYYNAPHQFTADELNLALTIARQLGFSVERIRTESALRESEDRYRTLVEQVKDYAIFRTDRHGRPTSWNEGVRRVLGFRENEFIGCDIVPSIFTPDDVRSGVPETELREAADYGTASNDRWMRRKDGSVFYATGVTTALRDAIGDHIGFTKVLRDETAAKQAEDALAEAQAKLHEHAANLERAVAERTHDLRTANEQLEAFVYSIAHDLRAPLRSMSGFSQLLVEDYAPQLDATAKNLLQRIQASAEFMDKLLLDLLAYGRVVRAEMELTPVELRTAWDAAMFQCAPQIEHSRARIETIEPLPAVRAHEATLGQCLANLLSNALKFVASDVTPHVRFWAEKRDDYIRAWIEDNGIGIPPEQQERAFRVFERLHGAQYLGTGIGLSIVRKGIERMGGRVGLQSELGKGSRFWIELEKAD